jgi:hypothetical protein
LRILKPIIRFIDEDPSGEFHFDQAIQGFTRRGMPRMIFLVAGLKPHELALTTAHELAHCASLDKYENSFLESRARLFEYEFGNQLRGTSAAEVVHSLGEIRRTQEQKLRDRFMPIIRARAAAWLKPGTSQLWPSNIEVS